MVYVRNWQDLSRAIIKLIRERYDIDEVLLKRTAILKTDLGLKPEEIEGILKYIGGVFGIHFPDGALKEVLKVEDLCMLCCWLKGYSKQPAFISPGFAGACRAVNPAAG